MTENELRKWEAELWVRERKVTLTERSYSTLIRLISGNGCFPLIAGIIVGVLFASFGGITAAPVSFWEAVSVGGSLGLGAAGAIGSMIVGVIAIALTLVVIALVIVGVGIFLAKSLDKATR